MLNGQCRVAYESDPTGEVSGKSATRGSPFNIQHYPQHYPRFFLKKGEKYLGNIKIIHTFAIGMLTTH